MAAARVRCDACERYVYAEGKPATLPDDCPRCGAAMPHDPIGGVVEKVQHLMLYSATSESIYDLLGIVKLAAEHAVRLAERDPELRPEMAAVADSLSKCAEGITAAFEVANARLEVNLGG